MNTDFTFLQGYMKLFSEVDVYTSTYHMVFPMCAHPHLSWVRRDPPTTSNEGAKEARKLSSGQTIHTPGLFDGLV